ncbi:MAG: hypothetical protein ACOYN0_16095, partial [Phycisphaerales bacterium]
KCEQSTDPEIKRVAAIHRARVQSGRLLYSTRGVNAVPWSESMKESAPQPSSNPASKPSSPASPAPK